MEAFMSYSNSSEDAMIRKTQRFRLELFSFITTRLRRLWPHPAGRALQHHVAAPRVRVPCRDNYLSVRATRERRMAAHVSEFAETGGAGVLEGNGEMRPEGRIFVGNPGWLLVLLHFLHVPKRRVQTMNVLLAICMMVTASFIWAGENPAPNPHDNLGSSGASATGVLGMGMAYPEHVSMTFTGDIHVPKASGANARTVAEIITKGDELRYQTVLVRGKVVKYNPEIMGRNWVHLRDGTGSALDNSNDLLVTTTNQAEIGDVVTAKGIVRTDMDFGSGYAYKVLIEEATLE
jgi:hypothetical protein